MSIPEINKPIGPENHPINPPIPKPSKLSAVIIEMLVSAVNGYLATVQSNQAKNRAQDIANERDVKELSRAEAIQGEADADSEGKGAAGKVSSAGVSTGSSTPTASASLGSSSAGIAAT
ncbi:MAG: hypothetical protein S4CHLAM6_10190 [Chlamydiae bacterium]|nr:hypothetical protein [Chlamydiota bacterium]